MPRRLLRALFAAVLCLATVSTTVGWISGERQEPVTGPPPGTAAWRADGSLGRSLPDPATVAPRGVADFFDGLSFTERRRLAHRHPEVVGNLDGAPIALRYTANRLALRAASEAAGRRADDPSASGADRKLARERVERYRSLLAPGRRFLAFDPRGRGQIAEVYGDLLRARHTAVTVPGTDIDLASFDRDGANRYGTPAGMARALRTRMAQEAPGTRTAVIAWTGYTTPKGIGVDAATGRLAAAGAPRLAELLRGLAARDVPAPAVFCHSYGSVVCGRAARDLGPGELSDLVLFGSPGTGADAVSGLGDRIRVWAARGAGDWIAAVPHTRLLGLGHGPDPAAESFGARVVTTSGSRGHAGYFTPGTESLANFARITLGSFDAVRCTDASRWCGPGR
ncbi:hypothetical protein E0L36_03485 [Streptomyces sp. AJS327]|uniref:alpha/beta hydrolase n=1 Tax=Streptomyces sp. AJS327 TaxID=2545265 RepID=UPI0015DDCC37|nr:alpha/beta hydrolase [Streptomyces sp. AJS327]MBA0049993.1 hypothetical protein [Streptomyces sp. AJS327]